MERGKHIIVRGLVQGVGYRWFAARRAESLGIRGSVSNRIDGTVDIMAAGEEHALESFVGDLRVGPRSAQVTDLIVEEVTPGSVALRGFIIR